MVAEDGKQRAVTCVDLDTVPMWLATIEASHPIGASGAHPTVSATHADDERALWGIERGAGGREVMGNLGLRRGGGMGMSPTHQITGHDRATHGITPDRIGLAITRTAPLEAARRRGNTRTTGATQAQRPNRPEVGAQVHTDVVGPKSSPLRH